jgi:hypothetical protein
LVELGDGDDVEAEAELEVVALHRRTELRVGRDRRRTPNGEIEVVPDDPPLGADDATPTAIVRAHSYCLEHALVMRQLESIAFVLPYRRRAVDHSHFTRRCLEV